MKENIEVKEISAKDVIHYTWKTANYGVAEFVICPVFKYGKLVDLYIYRRQQVEYNGYHINIKAELSDWKINEFQIEAYPIKPRPEVWRNWWCKEHKTMAFDVYVPENTNTIKFDYFFGNNFRLQFRSELCASLSEKGTEQK